MKNVTLLIMAAGIGSRYGEGVKQLEPIGLNNEMMLGSKDANIMSWNHSK